MEDEDSTIEEDREAMAAVIAVHARLSADMTGRAQLSETVMQAMLRTPRHKFVPDDLQSMAYEDTPLPIGHDKTISQPFIVALMTDLLEIERDHKVLEVGTGLGYQAAVLAELSGHVFSVELVDELAREAEIRLARAGYGHVRVRVGDGGRGWAGEDPFDRIIVSAAPLEIPESLVRQLKPGGRLIAPQGDEGEQWLTLVEKSQSGELTERRLIPVRFSALTLCH